jgi:hypothetical protein
VVLFSSANNLLLGAPYACFVMGMHRTVGALAGMAGKACFAVPLLCSQRPGRLLSDPAWQPHDSVPAPRRSPAPHSACAACQQPRSGAQLLEGLRPELERRLNLEPGDDETWADITDGAAEGVEQFAFLRAPDVWVRAPAAAGRPFMRALLGSALQEASQ